MSNDIRNKGIIYNFSLQLYKDPKYGLLVTISLNLLFIYVWKNNIPFLSFLIYLFILYLIISILLSKILQLSNNIEKHKEIVINKEKAEQIGEYILTFIIKIKEISYKVIKAEDCFYSARIIIELFLLMYLLKFTNPLFILWFISNVCLLYALIENKYPLFIFKSLMTISQILEGISIMIEGIIPRYDDFIKAETKAKSEENK